jgi:hypothetical protein
MGRAWFERLGTFVGRGIRYKWAQTNNLMESLASVEEGLLSCLVTPFIAITNSLRLQNSYDFEPAACRSEIKREPVVAPRPQLDSLPFPDDVTLLVLRKLAAQDDAALARASCTCKSLNRLIAGEGDLWRVAFHKKPEQPCPDGLDEAANAFGGYRALIAARAARSCKKMKALLKSPSVLDTEFLVLGCVEGKPVAWATAEASGPPEVNRHVRVFVGGRQNLGSVLSADCIAIYLDTADSEFPVVQIDRSGEWWHEHACLERDKAQQLRKLDMQGFALDRNEPSGVIACSLTQRRISHRDTFTEFGHDGDETEWEKKELTASDIRQSEASSSC